MTNEVAVIDEERLIGVLQSSLYPGAQPSSVAMVLAYCQAARLDPMQKPVHIVPMTVKVKGSDGYDKFEKRDTIMPGIGLYRVQAARTGEYAGQEKAVFGPMVEKTMTKIVTKWVAQPGRDKKQKVEEPTEITFSYPEWCEVTVYRLVGGEKCAFTATEYWEENYATASRDTEAPNEMWQKRARGQLAKCTEAQALRKAFPEAVGAAPTAEEMEGKHDFDPNAQPAPAQPRLDGQPEPAGWPAIPQTLIDLGATASGAGEQIYALWWSGKLTKAERLLLQHRHAGWKVKAAESSKLADSNTFENGADPAAPPAAEEATGDPWVDAYETNEGKTS